MIRMSLFLALTATVCLPAAALSQGPDALGVYFDQVGTVNRATTTTAYQPVPVYLVLQQPSEQSGVGGWEARIEMAAAVPLPPISWTLAGYGINFASAPDFQVGLGQPLPWASAVVLASGVLLVPAAGDEVEFRIGPAPEPSLVVDGYPVQAPAYTAGGNADLLIPLTPSSGCETAPVAIVNDDGDSAEVVLSCAAAQLDFGNVLVGNSATRDLVVDRLGGLEASFEATVDSSLFALRTGSGPWSPHVSFAMRYNNHAQTVSVMAVPQQAGDLRGTVSLTRCGEIFATVALTGQAVTQLPDYEIVPTTLSFGEVALGAQSATLYYQVLNHTYNVIQLTPHHSCAGMWVYSPYVQPGSSAQGNVRWTPQAEGPFVCVIDFGGGLQLTCTGTGVAAPAACEVSPTSLDFGEATVGDDVPTQSFSIRNTGGQPLSGVVPASCGAFTIGSAGPFQLLPGQTRWVQGVRFAPPDSGSYDCVLDLGAAICSDVTLTGRARQPDPACGVAEPVVFEVPYPRPEAWTFDFSIVNTGGLTLTGSVPASCGPFQIVSGAGAFALAMGERRDLKAAITAVEPETVSCTMEVEGLCGEVTLEARVPACQIVADDTEIWCAVGLTAHGSFTVENIGTASFTVSPRVGYGSAFSVDPGPFTVAPGASQVVGVSFHPILAGTFGGEIEMPGVCRPVQCTGYAEDTGSIGIFFDREATRDCVERLPGQPRTAYLCIVDSSDDIARWECLVAWDGAAVVDGWQLENGGLNALAAPDFKVSVLANPLPWAQSVVLASFQVVPADQDVRFTIHAPSLSSFPGYPSYRPASDPMGSAIPLVPVSGSVDLPVAAVTASCHPVPVLGGIPTAQLVPADAFGGPGVRLQWRYDPGRGDGCQVYRRQNGAGEERLTSAPLRAADGRVEFVDAAAGVPAGARLGYAFALLRDGAEIARSSEVEVTWTPPLPSALALQPCRPNPFNPQTTIVFDLPRAGRVRLAMYDVAGRLVRTLVDRDLEAGTHREIWNGTDDTGRRVPSGTYYCRLSTSGGARIRKATLLK